MKYIFATNNPGKTREIKAMFKEAGREIITLADLNLSLSPDENGSTFEENSFIKASETAAFLQKNGYYDFAVLADDSGLEIDFMDKKPGVLSALFMGADTPYIVRNKAILETLKGIPKEKRTARFVCVITCVLPSGQAMSYRGELEAFVSDEIKGENGFGYDPIIYIESLGKTLAELSGEEKNKISHRSIALRGIVGLL